MGTYDGELLQASALVFPSDADGRLQNKVMELKGRFPDKVYLCDGTGDQADLLDAINSLPSSGGTVKIFEGNYYYNGNIAPARSNVTLDFDTGAKWTQASGSNVSFIAFTGTSGTHLTNVRVRGGVFDADSTNNSTSDRFVFYTVYVDGFYVDSTRFLNLPDYAMKRVTGGTSHFLSRSYLTASTGGFCHSFDLASECYTSSCYIGAYYTSLQGCIFSGIVHGGCYLDTGQFASGNKFTAASGSSLYCVNVEYCTGNTHEGVRVVNNYIDGTGATSCGGIGFTPNSSSKTYKNLIIKGNYIKNTISSPGIAIGAQNGITGTTISNVTIAGNIFDTCGTYSVSITENDQSIRPSNIYIAKDNISLTPGTDHWYTTGGDSVTTET